MKRRHFHMIEKALFKQLLWFGKGSAGLLDRSRSDLTGHKHAVGIVDVNGKWSAIIEIKISVQFSSRFECFARTRFEAETFVAFVFGDIDDVDEQRAGDAFS